MLDRSVKPLLVLGDFGPTPSQNDLKVVYTWYKLGLGERARRHSTLHKGHTTAIALRRQA